MSDNTNSCSIVLEQTMFSSCSRFVSLNNCYNALAILSRYPYWKFIRFSAINIHNTTLGITEYSISKYIAYLFHAFIHTTAHKHCSLSCRCIGSLLCSASLKVAVTVTHKVFNIPACVVDIEAVLLLLLVDIGVHLLIQRIVLVLP